MASSYHNSDYQSIRLIDMNADQLKALIKNTVQDCINEIQPQEKTIEQDEFLTTKEAALFLKEAVQTIYQKVRAKELPYMKRSKRLYFSKKELIQHLKQGRVKTNAELREEVKNQSAKKKKGGRK